MRYLHKASLVLSGFHISSLKSNINSHTSFCRCLSHRQIRVFICVCLTVTSQHENTASASICQLVWMGLKMVSLSQQAQIPSQIAWGCSAYLRPPSDFQSHKLITNIQQVQTAALIAHRSESLRTLVLTVNLQLLVRRSVSFLQIGHSPVTQSLCEAAVIWPGVVDAFSLHVE